MVIVSGLHNKNDNKKIEALLSRKEKKQKIHGRVVVHQSKYFMYFECEFFDGLIFFFFRSKIKRGFQNLGNREWRDPDLWGALYSNKASRAQLE